MHESSLGGPTRYPEGPLRRLDLLTLGQVRGWPVYWRSVQMTKRPAGRTRPTTSVAEIRSLGPSLPSEAGRSSFFFIVNEKLLGILSWSNQI